MRVAIVHDDLVQRGGAEKVLEGLCEIYPDAPIYTSLYDTNNADLTKSFGHRKIITSFIQNIPGWKSLYKLLLPFYPLAFEQFDFSPYDLVISHTTRFAKSIITKPYTKHISYCHTPPRFLWHFSGENSYGLGEILMTKLRLYDQITANRVDHFLAGSINAKERIKKIYRADSLVVYPFIDLDRFTGIKTFDGGYFLVIARLNRYKNIDLVIDLCLQLGLSLKVIGDGPQMQKLRDRAQSNHFARNSQSHFNNIEFLGNVSDEMVVQTIAGCSSLIIAGVEDFGLTALEAQALGKPVIALSEGGALETVIDGKTGILCKESNLISLQTAIRQLDSIQIDPQTCRQNAKRFSKANFIRNFQHAIAALV